MASTISDFGEKALIENFIKPLFNPSNDRFGIGDDCAMISSVTDSFLLLSTDRVPADLTAFKLGIIDFTGLGKYLAHLNISDIAACGGSPIGLLLNLGLPQALPINDLLALLNGVKEVVDKYNCQVLGGDITSASELSISATSIGHVQKDKVLSRRNAKAGDLIFTSRPIGMTPAAFEYFCKLKPNGFTLNTDEESILVRQFTDTAPFVDLGKRLSSSGYCTSCMDNTDGLGQSLLELSQLSDVSMHVKSEQLYFDLLVKKLSPSDNIVDFAFGPGADFSLVGTLSSKNTIEKYASMFPEILIIGEVEIGEGVYLDKNGDLNKINFKGWSYFEM